MEENRSRVVDLVRYWNDDQENIWVTYMEVGIVKSSFV